MGEISKNTPILRLFDEIAPTYDLLNHLFSVNLDRYWRNCARRTATFPSGAVVLDLCSGTADVALTIAKHQQDSRIYGLDASANMLSRARIKLLKKDFLTRISLIHADALRLPFPAESFDLVFLSFGLRNLADRQQGLREIVRVLKTRGQLVVLEFASPTSFTIGRAYRLYLHYVIPFIGKLISRCSAAYQYLYSSIEEFLSPEEVMQLLHAHRFQHILYRPLTLGIVSLYVAQQHA
jgi:demethylmenaquinone methyltransferase/2-methoxy-6-polyprenyl-1,4-benzoquinol methylase